MIIEKVTKEYAAEFQQEKRFGVISEGCIGVWGEGDTVDDALADAKMNMREHCGCSPDGVDISLNGCWIMEINEEDI